MAIVVAAPLVPGATQVVRSQGPARYCGLVLRETSGVALVLRLFDSASAASGTLVDVISVAANGVARSSMPGDGVHLSNGLVIERVSGTNYEGSVQLG